MSSINPVGRSMNGIKTIETASLIFTDDNSSLNTSAGIVSAQANSTTAINGKINSVGFNTSNGVLTLTKEDGGTLTKDLDGRYLESVDADDIPNLPASKITSGTFGTARIPNLPASKITSGTLATAQIPNLNADKINTGTLATARIPDLNASKINTGTLGDARIPNLNASKINAGTLGTARIPDLPYVSVGTSGTHTDETIFGVKTFNEPPVCATQPTNNNQLANRQFVLANSGGGGDAVLSAGTASTPQQFTGVCDFNGGSLQMSNPNQTFSMIQPNINTSDVNTFAMTGRRNRITQNGLSNAILNEFTQSGGTNTASAISQFTANSLIYQDPTTARFVTNGSIGVGISGFNPSAKLDVTGNTKLRNNGAYIYVYSGQIFISGNTTSYTGWDNGGHHIDAYTTSNGAGRRMYINYYANQGVTLTRSNITSDDRIKEEEKFIENATDTLMKLRPQTYIKYAPVIDGSTIKPNFDLSGNFESGLIAQEIYYDCPELKHIVSITDMSNDDIIPSSDDPTKDPDYSDWGDMTAGVDYIQIIPYLIKSIQELNARVKELEAKI